MSLSVVFKAHDLSRHTFFNMICKISTVRKSGHMFRQQFKDEFETSRQPITVRPQHKHLHKTSKQGTVLICLRFCLIMIIFIYIFRCLPTKDAESQHLLHICLIILRLHITFLFFRIQVACLQHFYALESMLGDTANLLQGRVGLPEQPL